MLNQGFWHDICQFGSFSVHYQGLYGVEKNQIFLCQPKNDQSKFIITNK